MEQIRTCTNRFDAEAEAYDWSESLNSSFCGRHTFDVARVGEHFVITVEEDAQANICETGVE
ncbi:MAG TPA: hypothetical protein ENK93_05145 [Campylobacteraceae bacterium]|nr:hypothetical protein [Campylobacteraceae bacterium]HHD84246.1 hypothetical protein [Campylobacteraceae bacterium]